MSIFEKMLFLFCIFNDVHCVCMLGEGRYVHVSSLHVEVRRGYRIPPPQVRGGAGVTGSFKQSYEGLGTELGSL